ncbi:MAG: hypothetical protein QGG53_32250 [Planctomycetota bacterium]|nr:hypothetical protein [Planctomycetota bacterium]
MRDPHHRVLPGVLRDRVLDDFAHRRHVAPSPMAIAGLSEVDRFLRVAVGIDDVHQPLHGIHCTAVIKITSVWMEAQFIGQSLQAELIELFQIACLVGADAAHNRSDDP